VTAAAAARARARQDKPLRCGDPLSVALDFSGADEVVCEEASLALETQEALAPVLGAGAPTVAPVWPQRPARSWKRAPRQRLGTQAWRES